VTANLLLAIAFTVVMAIAEWLLRLSPELAATWLILRSMAQYGVYINFVLLLFNLIPIPPLDGSHVFAYLLPPRLAFRYRQIGMGGTVIVLILLWVTGFTFLLVPLNWLYGAAMVFKGILV
jgi:Zn-dependent protease